MTGISVTGPHFAGRGNRTYHLMEPSPGQDEDGNRVFIFTKDEGDVGMGVLERELYDLLDELWARP